MVKLSTTLSRNLINALHAATEELENPTLQVPQFVLFLEIAARGEVSMASLPQLIGYEQATVSRNVIKMSQRGLGLLESFDDTSDFRSKRVRLSSKGNKALVNILNCIS